MNKENYGEKLKIQNKLGENKDMCFLCGEDDPRLLEKHHWKGRANSDETVYLCLNHHRQQTLDQNKLAPKYRTKNANPKIKRLNMLRNQILFQKGIIESTLKITEVMFSDTDSSEGLFKTKTNKTN